MPYTSPSSIERRKALANAMSQQGPTGGRYGGLADALRAYGGYRGGVLADEQTQENERLKKSDMARLMMQVTGQPQGIGPLVNPGAQMETPEGQESATSYEMQQRLAEQKSAVEMAKALAGQRPPASVQEYEYSQGLQPAQRAEYLRQITPPAMPVVVDQGGSVGIYNRGDLQNPASVLPKTADPAKRPPMSPYDEARDKKRGEMAVEDEQKQTTMQEAVITGQQNAAQLKADIAAAKGKSSAWSTGLLGSLLRKAPGTEALSLDALLKPIKSSISLDALLALKQGGGTLGAVSEREIDLLEADLGALNPDAGRQDFEKQLESISTRADDIWKRISAAYQRKYGTAVPGGAGADEQAIHDEAMRIVNGKNNGK